MTDLVLRSCNKSGQSYCGFQWNLEIGGITTALDWSPEVKCGKGLHGFLNGEGNGSFANWSNDAIWMVVEPLGNVIDLRGKVKFQSAKTLFIGSVFEATNFLIQSQGNGYSVIGSTVTGGDNATVSGGDNATVSGGDNATVKGVDYATVTGGDYATVIGGYNATVTGGYKATVTGGDNATVSGGDNATVSGGDNATVIGGYKATVTGGDYVTVTGGYKATVTGGNEATVTGGKEATVTGGDNATVSGGDKSILCLSYYQGSRKRLKIAYVGEDGILSNTPYRLNENFEFESVALN